MSDRETLEQNAREVKALANAQRTHVGRAIVVAPVEVAKLTLPAGVKVEQTMSGYLVMADPDPLKA